MSFNTGTILFKKNLLYSFYDVKAINNHIYLITELEIIKIDLETYEVVNQFELPDFFSKIQLRKDVIEVTCIGGEVLTID